jgi:hypothetical protein
MSNSIYSFLLFKALYAPKAAFARLVAEDPAPLRILFRYSLWLLLLPPLFSFVGASQFGWRLGATEPLFMENEALAFISIGYFCILFFGLVTTALISRWMADTYGANASFGRHVALIMIVGEPLAVASVAHLFPDVFLNALVLIPTTIWAMYLLYTGIPLALDIPPERGMLMASSLVGWLLVAAVSLLGINMSLWTLGIGPLLGV